MKLERTKNAGKGMAFEILKNINGIVLSFICRTAMIYCLGIEYTGLGGLYASILNVLNLVELGVGTAMIFSMYKPIAEDNAEKLCALVNLYKKYLRVIGAIILGIGLCIMPFLDHLISGDVPKDINIYILFLMNLGVTVSSYWFFAYKTCILIAHQKNYVCERIDVVLNIIFSVLQILVLIIFKNYYIYFGLELVRQICSNLVKAYAANKRYPQYKPVGKLDKKEEKELQKKVKDIFTSRIGDVVTNYADTLVISAFLGLTILAQYQNYFYIFAAVSGLVGAVFNSTRSGIGNSLVLENKKKNINDIRIFTLLIFFVSTICASEFICLYQPFIKIWVKQKNMLPFEIVICLSIMFVVQQYLKVLETYRTASGSWHYDRFRPFVAGIVNLILNILMIRYLKLYGVILSTIVSEVIVSIPWILINIFKNVFATSAKKFIWFTLKCTLTSAVIMTTLSVVSVKLPLEGIQVIVGRVFIGFIISAALYLIVFFRTKEMKGCFRVLRKMILKRDDSDINYNEKETVKKRKIENDSELHLLQLKILKFIEKMCKDNNLQYFLYAGTLLGAIRHKGFIPWDDDLDICMPRPDYIKLIEIMRNNNNGAFSLKCIELGKKEYNYCYAKMIDNNTIVKEKYKFQGDDLGVWVDIFPIDGIGNSLKKTKEITEYSKKYVRQILRLEDGRKMNIKGKILFLLGRKRLNKLLVNKMKKNNFYKSKYVTDMVTVDYDYLVFEEKNFEGERYELFEGHKFKVPFESEKILEKMYGNYMKLPPKEERKPKHSYNAWIIEE